MHLRAYKIYKNGKKEDKNRVGRCWIKFVLDQAFRPTFSGSSNQIFMLDVFESSVIQHLFFFIACKTYAVECVSNVFIDIWMSMICGVPQKVKRREGHKEDKREEVKLASKKEKDSNAKRLDRRWDVLAYWHACGKPLVMGLASHWLYQPWHKRDSIHGDRDIIAHKYSLHKH